MDILVEKARRCAVLVLVIFAALLGTARTAQATSYVGAWYVNSAAAVNTLQANGFNLFLIPAGDQTQFYSALAAVNPGNFVIAALDTANEAASRAFVTGLRSSPDYSKVVAYFTFDEPNMGNTIPLATQRSWYSGLKAIDPSKSVVEDFHVGSCGLYNPSVVDSQPGLSWDAAMVNFYPYRWGMSDADSHTNLRSAAAAVASYFNPSSFIIPVQQAAYMPTDPGPAVGTCGDVNQLRVYYDLSQQYGIWRDAGLLNVGHALFYYGWVSSESGNLQSDSFMMSQAAYMGSVHKSLFP
jgi:hypothetical protein